MKPDENEIVRSVASRLGILATTVKPVTVVFMVLVFGSLFVIGTGFFYRDYWWLGGIFGMILGYGFGIYLGSVYCLVIEWMAQVLGSPR